MLTLRPSSFMTFCENPKVWYARNVLHEYSPIGAAALLGSAVHYGIEHNTTNVKDKIDELVAKEFYDFKNLALERIYLEAPIMIEAYLQTDYKLIPNYAIEQRYTVQLSEDIELSGQCDRIAEDFTIIDYKTSAAKLGSADKYLPQLDIYAYLLKISEGIETTKGMLINIKRPNAKGISEVSHIDCDISATRGEEHVKEMIEAYEATIQNPALINVIYRHNPYSFIQ